MTAPAPTPNAMPGAAPAAAAPPAAPAAAPAAPAEPAAPAAPAPAPQPEPDNRPPWEKNGETFDPERAWKQIQNIKAELADYKTRTDPIVAEREQLRRASQSDLERAAEDINSLTGERDIWRQQAIQAKAEAMVAGRFIDAETALALIGDVNQYVTDGAIDVAKLTGKLDQLAVDKPFLVALPPQPPGFTPNRAQAQAGTGGAAAPIDEQIRAAEKSGNVSLSIALKQQKHAQLRQQTR